MSIHDMSIYLPQGRSAAHGLVRRSCDIALAALSIIALAPIMLLIAIAVFLEDAGPVFFRQERLGLDGLPFGMYKFRKFRANCGTSGAPLTVEGDSRLTAIGKFLATTKLDELPQLWNVLRGDMAVVGPRPESLAFADCFRDGYEEILRHKPGLVGPSQVVFRHEAKLYPEGEDASAFYRRVLFPAKAGLDLASFRHRSIGSDFALMLRSALAILSVSPPSKTASGEPGS
jgi:lipopolysaccharide/colanic/teichoic acid biosynthesis glycosyltransferase